MLDYEDGSHQTYVERDIGRSEEVDVTDFGFNYGVFNPSLFVGDSDDPTNNQFEDMFTL